MKEFAVSLLIAVLVAAGFMPRAAWVLSGAAAGRDEASPAGRVEARVADAPGVDRALPRVGSLANLKNLLREAEQAGRFSLAMGMAITGAAPAASAEAARRAAAGADFGAAKSKAALQAPADYSRTNVQVQGVDEADVVKTDGEYIYQVNGERVLIIKARPAAEMAVAAVVDLAAEQLQPRELYVDDKHLAVIGAGPGTVRVLVYDIADRQKPRRVREAEVEGDYLSSRKIGSALYLVANRPVYYALPQGPNKAPDPEIPRYRDSALGEGFASVDLRDVRYFPGVPDPSYLILAGLDLERPEQPLHLSSYLGAGQTIYASRDNLYVAVTRYGQGAQSPAGGPRRAMIRWDPGSGAASTVVYRFALGGGRVGYRAKGEVPGSILNQFSMDEHAGHFRIATTAGDVWGAGALAARNNLYVLDMDMRVVGRVEDIAPGERIYSVRFMGDRAYMVTFKKVDPLFVLDLKDPREPRILGALKIPGYSDYLHPYDENHIIGFGKDTVEAPVGVPWGGDGSVAFYQGLKVALFDVTDPARPVEMFKEIIGDRGTDSDLLRNHKALLFSKEKGLLAFPVTLREVRRSGGDENPGGAGRPVPPKLDYGELTFQGLYVYRLDLEGGFQLRDRITHMSPDDYLKAGDEGDWLRRVERGLYIGDTLYTLSRRMVQAHDLHDLREIGRLELPAAPYGTPALP